MVFDKAAEAHKTDAHERQWGACLTQLLCEVELWGKESRVIELNVWVLPLTASLLLSSQWPVLSSETCSIQPDVMRPIRPEGVGYIDLEVGSNNTRATAAESLGRMVDRCLGFKMSFDHKNRILRAWRKLYDNEFSLNQSISYISSNLIFIDFEVKKKVAGSRDPLVQLTIWEMAWLLKRQHHGWDTSMPMPGIAINGHLWECYLFFEMNGELVRLPVLIYYYPSTNIGLDCCRANSFWHHGRLARNMANPLPTAYSDGVGPHRVHSMVRRAHNRRLGGQGDVVDFMPIVHIYDQG